MVKVAMKCHFCVMLSLLILAGLTSAARGKPKMPIALHPKNPHYFLFRNKPTILITSAAHYGQVLNLDFDFLPSLDVLKSDGLNYARIFTGEYCEDDKSFSIRENVLAPKANRLLCPWARSATPGYANGGNKFDLTKWDDAYFQRLKAFCTEAGKRGIVVEISLFCPFYEDSMWSLSPLNAANNVSGVGNCAREEVYALKHAELTAAQDAMTRKIVEELHEFDNVFYEICNEPYFGGVTLEWQRHISSVIAETEAKYPYRHLIAQNISNGSQKIENPDPNVSIFNFHYAAPPDAVRENYGLDRAIGCDETGFKGVGDLPYRTEGWDFLFAGGGLYNNLDYSFTVSHPDGTGSVTDPTPGGGGPSLRGQLKTLHDFLTHFDFIRMKPDTTTVQTGGLPKGATVRTLSEPGKAYAIYIKGGIGQADLHLDLPAGNYRAVWVNPRTGGNEDEAEFKHAGGNVTLRSPDYREDIALGLVRK